jgi:hypothetical protein
MSPHSKIILIIDVYERTPINSFDYQYSEQITHIRLYVNDITLCRNDLSLHLYQLYIRLLIC